MNKIYLLIFCGLFSICAYANKQETLSIEEVKAQLAAQEFSVQQVSTLPRGYLSGYHLSNADDYAIQVGPGEAKDIGNNYDIRLLVSFLKIINCNWQAGNGTCGLAPTLKLKHNQTYHIFAMMNDAGNVDVGFDESVDGVYLQFYTGYKSLRRIGSIYTISDPAHQAIEKFTQQGDYFYLNAPKLAFYDSYPAQNTAHIRTLPVPKGIKVISIAHYNARGGDSTGSRIYVTSLLQADAIPSGSYYFHLLVNSNSSYSHHQMQILTDMEGRIRYRLDNYGAREFSALLDGWIDHRDRL